MLNLFKLYKGVLTCCRTLAKKKKKRANDGEYLRSISSKWLSNYNIIIFVLIPRYVCLNEQNSTVIHVGKSIETKGHFNWSPCILNKGFLNSKCLLLIHLVVCLVGEVNFVEYKKKNLFCDHKVCHWVTYFKDKLYSCMFHQLLSSRNTWWICCTFGLIFLLD